MASYMVTYDLKSPGKDYTHLVKALQTISSTWWHFLGSSWIINTNLTSQQIFNAISPFIDSNDRLLVVRLERDSYWSNGLNNATDQNGLNAGQWLKDHLAR